MPFYFELQLGGKLLRNFALKASTIAVLSVLLFACSDDPSPVGTEIIPPGDNITIDTLDSYVDTLEQSSNFYSSFVDLGLSENLMLGKKDNVESSFIQDFYFTMEDTTESDLLDDSLEIVSAKLTLPITYKYGDESAPFDFSVYAVKGAWGITKFDLDSLNNLDIDYATDVKLLASYTDTTVVVDLNTEFVKNMMKTYSDTSLDGRIYGMYFKPSSICQKILGFQAFSTTADYNSSVEVVVRRIDGSYQDTLSFGPRSDTHILDAEAPASNNGELTYIQGGIAVSSILKFDVSSLPQNIAINYASLQLTLDSTQSIIGDPTTTYIGVWVLNDWDTHLVDSNSSAIYITRDGYSISGNIGSIVQRWTTGGEENNGIRVFLYNERSYLDKFVIYGSAAADPLKRPRLIINYSKLK